MSVRYNIDEERLFELCSDPDNTLEDVADEFGCSSSVIYCRLKEYGTSIKELQIQAQYRGVRIDDT